MDPLYTQQWALNNTGQLEGTPDADIDAFEAWQITEGSTAIKIAILDDGVQTSHPDFSGNYLIGSDMTSGITPCALSGTYGQPNTCTTPGDSHGTLVAGIAAANGCTGIGIMGVSYKSKVIPIRVYYGSSGISNNDWIANGIIEAKNWGADVINMSFTLAGLYTTVDAAIADVIANGRGGKGCLLVAAAGNNGVSSIGYPASHSSVIAVGNSNNHDLRHYTSNYGSGLDVMAPGTAIMTTDLVGAKGINSSGDHHYAEGTSMASPHAGGVLALVLSINPNLTHLQARMLLESTTDKVNTGTYVYSSSVTGQPNGTWNNEMAQSKVALETSIPM